MNYADVMHELDSLTGGDPELAHVEAERILLAWIEKDSPGIGKQVADAYREAKERCGFWYA